MYGILQKGKTKKRIINQKNKDGAITIKVILI